MILNFFKELSKSKNDEIKCNFLLNLPAMNKLVDKGLFLSYKAVFLEMGKHKAEKVRLFWISILPDLIEFVPDEDKLVSVRPTVDWMFESEEAPAVLEEMLNRLCFLFKTFYAGDEEAMNTSAALVPQKGALGAAAALKTAKVC